MNKNKKTRHDGRTITVEGEEAKRRKAKEIATRSKDNKGTAGIVIMSCIYTSGASRPPDKEKEGGGAVSKKHFSAPRASVWSKNKGGGPPRPLPWIRQCIQGSLTLTDSFQSRYTFDHVS